MTRLDLERVVELLALRPLPPEGGLWAQSWRDEHLSAIYFLLRPGDPSAMHRLAGAEVWHFYLGAAVEMLLLHPDGRIERPVLGPELDAGHRPQVAVPGGVWQGAATTGAWSLLGTTMAPPYRDADFELGDSEALAAGWPTAASTIRALRPRR
ncbi:MAG: cupin domain-containing protein [Acidimicrobiales bacterium]